MKSLVKKYTGTSLILRIVIGMVIGAVLGLVIPKAAPIAILGTLFVGALKAVAPILVFFLVMSSLSGANSGIGKQFRTVIGLYVVNTFLAAVLAVLFSFSVPLKVKLDGVEAAADAAPSGIGEVLSNLLSNLVDNPVNALANGNYLGILFWAVIAGLGLKIVAGDTTRKAISDFADVVSMAVRWIIQFAPFGILGLVFNSVSTNGLSIFVDYGKLLAVLVSCMAAMALIVLPLLVFLFTRKNPYPLVLKCLKDSGITAFFTRSSAANIPVNMELCEDLGLDRDLYSVSIPLGATINMNGAAITITVLTLATTSTLGIPVDIPSAVILSLLATVSACGASGVAGGSLLLIPMACSLFGIPADIAMQVVGIGFIIGVIQDSCETAINSSGDVILAATAEHYHRRKNGNDFPLVPKKKEEEVLPW